jgi:hypothetical protein
MRTFLLFVLLVLLVVLAFERRWIVVPPEHDPRLPLDVRAEPNWLTRYRFDRAVASPQACIDALRTSGVAFSPVADRRQANGCGWTNAVRVTRGAFARVDPFTASCPLALSFAMVERHAFATAARDTFDRELARIDHLGTYACRNVNHAASGRLSEHAKANALDVAGFAVEGGIRVTVLRDWSGTGEAAVFLRRAHERACRYARVVLGPEYNALHRDHFHLDAGGFRACR